jgi:hypothetical protein
MAHLATGHNELDDTLNDPIGIIHKLKALNNYIVNTSEGAAFQKELECLLMISEGTSSDLECRRKKVQRFNKREI